jgi:hypothetical protein
VSRIGDTHGEERGGDTIRADIFDDDVDILIGGPGPDTLNSYDADTLDEVRGGKGFDTCIVDVNDTYSSCEDLTIVD